MIKKDDEIELLKSALKYSNSTAALALIFLKLNGSSNENAIIKELERMITKTNIVLKRKRRLQNGNERCDV